MQDTMTDQFVRWAIIGALVAVLLTMCGVARGQDEGEVESPKLGFDIEEPFAGPMQLAALNALTGPDGKIVGVPDDLAGNIIPLVTEEKEGPLRVEPKTLEDGTQQTDVGYNMLQNPMNYTWGEWTTAGIGTALIVGSQTDWFGLSGGSSSGRSSTPPKPTDGVTIHIDGDGNIIQFQGSGSGGSGQQAPGESNTSGVAGGVAQ